MSSTKPTFVLVPGSFASPAWYEKVITLLEKADYEWVGAPLLTSNTEGKRKVPATMQDDAESIKEVISSVVASGKEVVVVMHSYGGYPGTEATKGLARVDLKKQGKSGGVVALVYVAAWMPALGKTIFELLEEPDFLKKDVTITHPLLSQNLQLMLS
jgi:pimeloyl-ACP methyl ester carboxylesterase